MRHVSDEEATGESTGMLRSMVAQGCEKLWGQQHAPAVTGVVWQRPRSGGPVCQFGVQLLSGEGNDTFHNDTSQRRSFIPATTNERPHVIVA